MCSVSSPVGYFQDNVEFTLQSKGTRMMKKGSVTAWLNVVLANNLKRWASCQYLQKSPFCLLKSFWISYTQVQWVGLQRRNMTRQFFPTLYLRIYVCPDPCFNHPQCTTQKYIKGWFLDPFYFSFNSWLARTLKTDYEKLIICRKMSVN